MKGMEKYPKKSGSGTQQTSKKYSRVRTCVVGTSVSKFSIDGVAVTSRDRRQVLVNMVCT